MSHDNNHEKMTKYDSQIKYIYTNTTHCTIHSKLIKYQQPNFDSLISPHTAITPAIIK